MSTITPDEVEHIAAWMRQCAWTVPPESWNVSCVLIVFPETKELPDPAVGEGVVSYILATARCAFMGRGYVEGPPPFEEWDALVKALYAPYKHRVPCSE